MMIADVVTETEEKNVDVIGFRQFGMLPEGADYAARQGASWEPVKVDLFKTKQYDPKYLNLNPKGRGALRLRTNEVAQTIAALRREALAVMS